MRNLSSLSQQSQSQIYFISFVLAVSRSLYYFLVILLSTKTISTNRRRVMTIVIVAASMISQIFVRN